MRQGSHGSRMFDLMPLPDDRKRMVVSDFGHSVTGEELMGQTFALLDKWLHKWLDER